MASLEGTKSRKIVVGCDGTWLNSELGYKGDYWVWSTPQGRVMETPSNVTRMCRALQHHIHNEPGVGSLSAEETDANTGAEQIVHYVPGVGSSTNWWDHYINGLGAFSVGENVCAAYNFVVENWRPGDEIYILGFSRGAFIARSIAAMISNIGLLNKTGMEYFYQVFQDWENQNNLDWKQIRYTGKASPTGNRAKSPKGLFTDFTDVEYCSYAKQLAKDNLTRLGVRIKAVACWDTVGSLGIPTLGWRKPNRAYAFVNTNPPAVVDNCFHALSIDEFRKPFSPTIWELPDSRVPGPSTENPCHLRQCWFPGVHSNIGGSVADAEIPNLSLAWMTAQLAPFLDFDGEYLEFCRQVNVDYYQLMKVPARHWGMGYIKNPQTGFEVLAGSKGRTPGQYYRMDPKTAAPMNPPQRLKNTCEVVHPSVRVRRYNKLHGKGVDDKGIYDPPALKGFSLKNPQGDKADESDPRQSGYTWEFNDAIIGKIVLPEESLSDIEIKLLEQEGTAPLK